MGNKTKQKRLVGLRGRNKEVGNKRPNVHTMNVSLYIIHFFIHADSKEHGDDRRWVINGTLAGADLQQESECV